MAGCQATHMQLTHRIRGRRASGGSYRYSGVRSSWEQTLQRTGVMRPVHATVAFGWQATDPHNPCPHTFPLTKHDPCRSRRRHDGRDGGVSDWASATDPPRSRPSCLRRFLQVQRRPVIMGTNPAAYGGHATGSRNGGVRMAGNRSTQPLSSYVPADQTRSL